MKTSFYRISGTVVVYWLSLLAVTAQSIPTADQRYGELQTLNTPRTFPDYKSRNEWKARAQEIREQVLVSCGLWPMPEKTPLNAKIFDRVERDGYSVEKVYFQTYPGFYLSGNLYRPRGQGNGPFPVVVNPHGHWKNGRFADEATGSIAGRCINFAKQGMVAFSYDMVGYNDTMQLGEHRKFFLQPELQLWHISLMGLQTWNSIRALDFVESLADVDRTRLACTGESGGGTQTFMLGAVDDRLAAQAPIVMVSHSMQGGCQCENAPTLRVDQFNVEIAAVPAPRAQIIVGATGDWTRATMTMEGPAMARIYSLFKAQDKFRYVRFDFNHNYNQTSREAVYGWFDHWLLGKPDAPSVAEVPFKKEADQDLRVFPDGKLPDDALNETQFIEFLEKQAKAQLQALKPFDKKSLVSYQKTLLPAWRHSLLVEVPEKKEIWAELGETSEGGGYTATSVSFGRVNHGDRIPGILLTPAHKTRSRLTVLLDARGKAAFMDSDNKPSGLALRLLDGGQSVLLVDLFLTGERADKKVQASRKLFDNYFTTYNRTDVQERVQDILTACAFGRRQASRVTVCGQGRAGLWALLAAPGADAVAADADTLNASNDQLLLAQDLFSPGLQKLGGFEGVAALAAPNPLFIHNTGAHFLGHWLKDCYASANASTGLMVEDSRLNEASLAAWLVALR